MMNIDNIYNKYYINHYIRNRNILYKVRFKILQIYLKQLSTLSIDLYKIFRTLNSKF